MHSMLMNYPFDFNFRTTAYNFLTHLFMGILPLILLDISFIITVCFRSLLYQTSESNLNYIKE